MKEETSVRSGNTAGLTTIPVESRRSTTSVRSIRSNREYLCAILILGLYSLSVSKYLLEQHYEPSSFAYYYGENDATIRRCVDGLWTPQDSSSNDRIHRSFNNNNKRNKSVVDFRILCTSAQKRIPWGSYQIRCNGLKRWVNTCAPNVDITVGVSIEQLHERWRESKHPQHKEETANNNNNSNTISAYDDVFYYYNATIFVKSMSKERFPRFGKKFIDMVDDYKLKAEDIPSDMHLILQTKRQGEAMFPNHAFSVVEHWYNSYPTDMLTGGYYPDYIPPIIDQKTSSSRQQSLHIATIWNTRRHVPTEGGCPTLDVRGVTYDCIDEEFDITSWYLDWMTDDDAECQMVRTMAHPQQLGTGMLYYHLFRRFDAVVVLAKNDSMKLEYGNVQRALSQMRSGVPVLLEIRGRVLEEFRNRYNYSCVFRRDETSTTRGGVVEHHNEPPLLSFDDAVAQLKNPAVRRDCQRQGLDIVNDYSPSKLCQEFLRTVGYRGGFLC